MSSPTRLCGIDDLSFGEARRYEVDGIPICLARCEDGYHAIGDICSHEDYELSEGEVDAEGCEIECWKHGSLFSLATGEALTLPATRPVPVYHLSVEGSDVLIDLEVRAQ